jgi:conjugal transfer pilus assembly protein TraE
MKLKDFMDSWHLVQTENRLHRKLLIGLAMTNVLTALAVLRTERSVVLVPPGLSSEVEITRRQASSALKESWGLYLAELIGNVTPANAEFIQSSLGPLLASDIYRTVMEALAEQIHALKADRVTISFKPRQVFYEKETDTVFVTGDHVSQGPNSHPDIRSRTYEFRIVIRDYRPRLDAIDVYPEEPHTLDHQKKIPDPHSSSDRSTS